MKTKVLNALSFDVEEYFHALNFRTALARVPEARLPESRVEIGVCRILEILSAASTRATFFILGAVARAKPRIVKEIAACGHEIASHGMSHKTAGELGPERFLEEARASRALLQDLAGGEVAGFRASTFSITDETLWALQALAEAGYTYDSSIFPVHHDRYGIPEFPRHPVSLEAGLVEFPLLTLRVGGLNVPCGGGGYFRLFPLAITLRALARMNAQGFPAVIYLHPWEFDPNQPREPLGGLKGFRHYVNLHRTGPRLESLARRAAFTSLGDLVGPAFAWPRHLLKTRAGSSTTSSLP